MAQRRFVAYRSAVIAFLILASAAWGAKGLLGSLGIGIPAFRIAGGMLLFIIAVEMVFGWREARKENAARADENMSEAPERIAVFRFALPMRAGPGAIPAVSRRAEAAGGNIQTWLALMGILLAVIASCLLVFLPANRLDRLMGVTGRVVLSRLLGVVLAALAVQ